MYYIYSFEFNFARARVHVHGINRPVPAQQPAAAAHSTKRGGLQEHGRAGQQRRADARRPGAAAEAAGATVAASASAATDDAAPSAPAPRFRDLREARRRADDEQERVLWQDTPSHHLLLLLLLISQAIATLTERGNELLWRMASSLSSLVQVRLSWAAARSPTSRYLCADHRS